MALWQIDPGRRLPATHEDALLLGGEHWALQTVRGYFAAANIFGFFLAGAISCLFQLMLSAARCARRPTLFNSPAPALPCTGATNALTRRAGGRALRPLPKRVIVDVREFMSSLPSVLHQQASARAVSAVGCLAAATCILQQLHHAVCRLPSMQCAYATPPASVESSQQRMAWHAGKQVLQCPHVLIASRTLRCCAGLGGGAPHSGGEASVGHELFASAACRSAQPSLPSFVLLASPSLPPWVAGGRPCALCFQ